MLITNSSSNNSNNNLCPCEALFRMTHPNNAHANNFLKSERNVFVIPYGKRKQLPKDLKDTIDNNTNGAGGIWTDINSIFSFETTQVTESRFKGFQDAITDALDDCITSSIFPNDVFDEGTLVKEKYRPSFHNNHDNFPTSFEQHHSSKKRKFDNNNGATTALESSYVACVSEKSRQDCINLLTNRCKYCNTIMPEPPLPPMPAENNDAKAEEDHKRLDDNDNDHQQPLKNTKANCSIMTSKVYAMEKAEDVKPIFNKVKPYYNSNNNSYYLLSSHKTSKPSLSYRYPTKKGSSISSDGKKKDAIAHKSKHKSNGKKKRVYNKGTKKEQNYFLPKTAIRKLMEEYDKVNKIKADNDITQKTPTPNNLIETSDIKKKANNITKEKNVLKSVTINDQNGNTTTTQVSDAINEPEIEKLKNGLKENVFDDTNSKLSKEEEHEVIKASSASGNAFQMIPILTMSDSNVKKNTIEEENSFVKMNKNNDQNDITAHLVAHSMQNQKKPILDK